jgi:hypothetical protein
MGFWDEVSRKLFQDQKSPVFFLISGKHIRILASGALSRVARRSTEDLGGA